MAADDYQLLLHLGFIVITAATFAFVGKLIRMPTIVGYILAGIVLGPVLHLVELDHSLELISELGIALLLFLVGLELSFAKVKDLGRVALTLGGIQVVLTATGGMLVAHFIGFSPMEAIFLGGTVTFSSTVVVIKLLDQKGVMNRLYARISIALFLAQDIVVIAALTVLTGFGGSEPLALIELLINFGKAFGGMAVLLILTLIAARYMLPRPFAWAARSPDTVFIWALCWCFVVVILAHQFHLSVEIGAFLAGIAIAQLPIHEDLHRRLHPLMTFFIAIFLVTLGIKMELSSFAAIWPAALGLSAFVLLIKPIIVFSILARMRFSEYTAFQTAIATGQVSEFAFILLALGATTGLIGADIVALGGLVGITTIALSSYLIIHSEALYVVIARTGILKLLLAKQEPDSEMLHHRKDHIIVVGMNALGREIVKQLTVRNERVLAIDTDPKKLEGLGGADLLIGNVEYQSVVEEVGLREARLVVSALQIEDTNHLLAYRCRSASVPCAIHAFDLSVVNDLLDLDTTYLMMPAADGILQQRQLMQQQGIFKL
ncbi:MAG: cation:proton antiporter [Opitutae bacterium]|nr:cation:proton antiporter [Opitutae bacterium]MDG1301037.1 cation:proton antiporter [Opitutae bacterium]